MFEIRILPRLVAVSMLAAALPLGALAQVKEPVKVGLVSSKSGVFAQQGEEVMRGVRFAIDEANAKGGVDGRKVEVSEADDEGTPDTGRRVAEKLARDGYNLITGVILSSVSLAIVPNLDRWDAAFFASVSKSDRLTGDSCKPRAFRTVQSDAMDIAMINDVAKGLKEQTFGVLAADFVWGRESGESFKKAAEASGKKVPVALYVPLGTKDFSPYISQLKAANVEAVWVAEVGRDAIAFVKQAEEFGLIPKAKLVGHALALNFMVDATGKALEGTRGNSTYTPDIDTPRNKDFVAGFKAKFNRLPTDNEGQAYNGAQVLFEGVRLAKSVKPEAVSKALNNAQINSVYGPVTMRGADHQLLIPNYMVIVKMSDGKLRPVIDGSFPVSGIPVASPLCKM